MAQGVVLIPSVIFILSFSNYFSFPSLPQTFEDHVHPRILLRAILWSLNGTIL